MAREQRTTGTPEPHDEVAADVVDTEKSEEVGPGQDGPDWKPSADDQPGEDEARNER